MTSMPTNGMPSWGGGLPPQAPTSSRQLHHASHAHHRANSADIIDASSSANPTSSKPSSSSQRRHKSRSGRSGRTRSSSDGVKMMKEQYHQQLQHQQLQHQQMQQQYYGGYPNYNYYQMQYPNQMPPPPPPGYGFHPPPQSQAPPPPQPLQPTTTSPPSLPINQQMMMKRQQHLPPFPMDHRAQSQRRMRGVSFDAASFPFRPMDPNLSPSHGGIPPSTRSAANTTTTSSGAFSAMNELYSVIGPTGGGGGGAGGGGSIRGGVGPRRGSHRRTQSDSVVVPREQPPLQLPSLPESSSVAGGGPPTHHMRTNSYGSQGSHQSFLARHLNNYGPLPNSNAGGGGMGMHPMGNYPDYIPGETAALLAQHHHHNNSNMGAGGKTKMHMRQNSVNLYMKPFKGEKQPKVCRDVIFVVLFILQLAIMIVVGLKFGPEAVVASSNGVSGPGEGVDDDAAMIMEDSDDLLLLDYRNILKIAITCGAFAIVVSALTLAFMMAMSRRLVYVALVLSIGVSFAWGTIGIGISPKSFVPITGIITLMLTVGYMFVVWDRIPFASANLTTALTGVRDNLSLVGVAFLFQFLALLFSIFYSFTFVGLHNATHNGELAEISDRSMIGLNVLLWVSFYWTFQVLRHVVIVTVAGTIGSWWFGQPSALCETFAAATVFNFGSICYGSLFVGVVQFLRQITEGLRPNRDGSAMMCLYECSLFFQEKLIGCVDNLADSFTPWAFTYIGLYHYGLKEAGHRANELFVRRGWSRIVTDDLISSVLAMVSLVIGGLSGSFAVILQALDGHGLTNFGHPVLVSFLIGFMVGIVLSAVLFQIIDSSVCAVIVCFAGSPVEFHRNHPALSHEMRNAWKEVWPGSLDIDNVGVGLGLA